MTVNYLTIVRFSLSNLFVAIVAMGIGISSTAAQSDDSSSAQGNDVAGTIIIKTTDPSQKPPVFFKATAQTTANVERTGIAQEMQLSLKIIQGDAEVVSLGLVGADQVISVEGEHIQSWAVRQDGTARFLDLQLTDSVDATSAVIKNAIPQTSAAQHGLLDTPRRG